MNSTQEEGSMFEKEKESGSNIICTGRDNKFLDLFYMHEFFSNGFISPNYLPDEKFADVIALTSYGEKYANIIRNKIKDLKESELNFALFMSQGYEELFIDTSNTNLVELKNILNDEIINQKMKFPWVFDRLLYDKFYDFYLEEPPERLSNEMSSKFLENTPAGVFQLGNNLIGPFGLLEASSNRFLKPTLNIALWHCPNPPCGNIHFVTLLKTNKRLNQIQKKLAEQLKPTTNPSFPWIKTIEKLLENKRDFYDDLLMRNLASFIMGSFNLEETKLILGRLIDDNPKTIRELVGCKWNLKGKFNADSTTIAKGLDKNQCLQLLLLMDDNAIIKSIEVLIDEENILIPVTEIRSPEIQNLSFINWMPTEIECSRFGIRNSEKSGNLALTRLKRLIKDIYQEPNELIELDWKLRHKEGDSLFEKLDRYVLSENPEKIIYDLILDKSAHLDKTFKFLRCDNFYKSPGEELVTIKKDFMEIRVRYSSLS